MGAGWRWEGSRRFGRRRQGGIHVELDCGRQRRTSDLGRREQRTSLTEERRRWKSKEKKGFEKGKEERTDNKERASRWAWTAAALPNRCHRCQTVQIFISAGGDKAREDYLHETRPKEDEGREKWVASHREFIEMH